MDSVNVNVSVLLCVYNGASTLKNCLDSLHNQEFNNYEIIVIDDGSTDDTWEILTNYVSDLLFYYKKENTGLTKSLNYGLSKCRGKYVARIDVDDISDRMRLKLQYAMAETEKCKFVTCYYNMMDAKSKATRLVEISSNMHENLLILRTRGTPFHHSTMFFNRDYVLAHGGYNVAYRTGQDFELWQRLITSENTQVVRQALVTVCVNQDNSITGRRSIGENLTLHYRIFYRAWSGNVVKALYFTVISVKPLRQIIKKCLQSLS